MGHHCSISTPLPEEKMLEALLDKLQKKDTYGVFAEPVDSEELPDYHEIIEHPMDFSTIRKKLSTGIYANLEQFESDVFLVCTNAMEYNAVDTIYFRQARSIQELARKKFQILRLDREETQKSEQNTQSNFVTKKPIKSSLCKVEHNPVEPGSHISSAATLTSAGDACAGLNPVQAGPPEQPAIVEGLIDGSSTCENRSEKGEEGSAKSSPVKLGRKHILLDEDHRTAYNVLKEQSDIQSDSLFAILENEPKHLVAVGLDAEYSYARSLARFAGSLGPIAWRIASEIIEKALPKGVKFGPGWVGEYEPLPTPVLFFESHSLQQSGHDAYFEHKVESWKDRAREIESKGTWSSATKTARLYPRGPSGSSTIGMIDGKANHLKDLSVHSEPVKQIPHLYRSNTGSQPTAMFLQQNSLTVTSTKDCNNIKVGTNVSDKLIPHKSSSIMGAIVDMAAGGPELGSEIIASMSDVTSGSKNNLQSGNFKQPEMKTCRIVRSNSCMQTRGTSSGKSIDILVGSSSPSPLGFISTNQMRPANVCFNGDKHVSAVELTSGRIPDNVDSSEYLVTNNQKQAPTFPSTSTFSAAATAAAQAWMSVGRSTEHKPAEASKLFKMQVGAASVGNLASESLASASRIEENGKNRPTPSVSQLPSRAASEEFQNQNRCLTSFPQVILTELSRFPSQTPWQGLVPHVQHKQNKGMHPPDLNISFHPPGSPVRQSGILVDSQQPDLALQL